MNISKPSGRTLLTASLAFAAMTFAPAGASALSVSVDGDDGNPVALPGPLTIRNVNPNIHIHVDPGEGYDFSVAGPGGQKAAAGLSCVTPNFNDKSNIISYWGNGAYTIHLTKHALNSSGNCTAAATGTQDVQFTINGGIILAGPPKAVLTRNPGKLFTNRIVLPANVTPNAIGNDLFYGHNSAINPDQSLATPAGQVYADTTAGTVEVPLDKGPGTYQLAGHSKAFNSYNGGADVFTPWAQAVQFQAFAPFDVKKLSFPDYKGPSYRIRATFNEVTVTGRVSIALARGTKGGKYRSLGSVKVSKHSVTKRFRATKAGTYRLRFKYKGNANVAGGYEVDKIRITRRISFRGASAAATRQLAHDPVTGAAHEANVLGARVGDDAEDRLVVVGAGAVEDLQQQELAGLDRGALGEGLADGELHRLALPAAILGSREGQRLIGLGQARLELGLLGLRPAGAGD